MVSEEFEFDDLFALIEILNKNLEELLRAKFSQSKQYRTEIMQCIFMTSSVLKFAGGDVSRTDINTVLFDMIRDLDNLISSSNHFDKSIDEAGLIGDISKITIRIKGLLGIKGLRSDNPEYEFFLNLKKELDDIRSHLNKIDVKTRVLDGDSDDFINDIKARLEDKFESVSNIESLAFDKFNQITDNLERNEKKIAETVGKLSIDSVSGRFNVRAEEERRSAEIMRGCAILFMCLAITLIFLSAFKVVDYFGWQDLIIRVLSTVTLFIAAGYFASEASKHHKLQHKYERIHLDLSAIDPFVANFDEEKQRELKSEVARRVFITSHSEDNLTRPSEQHENSHMKEILVEILNLLKVNGKKDT